MRQHSTETVDKSVCTDDGGGGAARLEAVLVALVERKARALHAEQARRRAKALTHPLLLFLRDTRHDESEASIVESPGEVLPSHWCEHEIMRHKHKKLKLHAHHRTLSTSDLELEHRRRRQKRRRRNHRDGSKPRKHRTLLVSSIDEQAKVIHVLDPDELPRRARYTIMVTACLLLFLCLLLVGVTLRMAPLIDDMEIIENMKMDNPRKEAKCETNEKEEVKMNNVDFDDILPHAGEFGLYQILLSLSTMPFYFFCVFVYFGQLFMTETPDHWCWIPELQNLTVEERKTLAVPYYGTGYDKCKSYVTNWSEVLTSEIIPDSTWTTEACQNGWEYNLTQIPYPTVSTEFNWVCVQDTYQASAQTIFFAGCPIGGIIFGVVTDKFGRLPAIVSCCLVGCVGGIASIFATNFIQFSVCRFFTGMAYDSCMMIVYLLVLEYIAPKYRTLLANLSFALFFSIAAVALPWIALACDHWKTFTLATSLPMALAVIVPWIMPESPRWLLSKGRIDEAVNKLQNISRINKKEIPLDIMNEFKLSCERKGNEHSGNPVEILKRPLLRKMFLLLCLIWFCCNIIFDILVRSLGVLDFDFFVSFSVVSATEFPALVIVALFMDWTGRRWLTTLNLFFCCIFVVGTYFFNGVASVICIIFARFFVNIGSNACLQWGSEMLPTPVRGTCTSIIHTVGYMAIMLSPFIVYLDTYFPGMPFIVVAVFAVIGGACGLCLPETVKRDMSQTMNDAENLMRNQEFWEFPCRKTVSRDKKTEGRDNKSYEP